MYRPLAAALAAVTVLAVLRLRDRPHRPDLVDWCGHLMTAAAVGGATWLTLLTL